MPLAIDDDDYCEFCTCSSAAGWRVACFLPRTAVASTFFSLHLWLEPLGHKVLEHTRGTSSRLRTDECDERVALIWCSNKTNRLNAFKSLSCAFRASYQSSFDVCSTKSARVAHHRSRKQGQQEPTSMVPSVSGKKWKNCKFFVSQHMPAHR